MTVTGRIEGLEETIKAFDRLGAAGKRHARTAIQATAEKVRADAVKSIQQGPKSGIVYERGTGQNLSPTHQASGPGQAPATDTGNLAGSGKTSVRGLTGTVRFTAPYAFWLEFGTLKMAPRPFLQPAFKANEQFLVDALRRGLDRATQEFNR